jgi:hypothetical protein
MADLGQDVPLSWYEFVDRDFAFLDAWERPTPPPPPETMSDRIECAAATAWSKFADASAVVAGSAAFETIHELYFTLRKALFQYARRNSFTKEECAVLLGMLSSEAIPSRGHRQPTLALIAQLKEALARVPLFQRATLQEAVRRCAHEVLAGHRHDN